MKLHRFLSSVAIAAALAVSATAHASLTTFQAYVGSYGVSTDGFGSLSQSGTLTANVPVGATVVAAYLYTSTFFNPTLTGVGGTLGGTAVSYTNLGVVADSCCSLAAGRADVTSIVKPVIDGGVGGAYNFTVTETSSSQDGDALVVVYSLPSLATSTVGILDGFSATGGDATSINFAIPLDPGAPGFFAEMRLGIGFSCCGQDSTVTVNGTTITTTAGNNDDGDQVSNGALFTMGGDNDPFSPLLPAYENDHERYNLVPQIVLGNTSISVRTNNPSRDDNIFLAVFHVTGEAGFTNNVPEPFTLGLVGLGLLGLGFGRKFAKRS